MEYYMDSEIEKKLINALIKDHPEFKKKLKIVYLWIGIAISLFLGVNIFILSHEKVTLPVIAAGLPMGLLIALLPAIWAQSTYFKAKKNCGRPYNLRERAMLKIYEDGVEIYYHDIEEPFPESMIVYRIPIENMMAMHYKRKYGLFTLVGKWELRVYDDFFNQRLNLRKSEVKFHSQSNFNFIIAREDREELAEHLRSMTVNGGKFS